MECEKCGVEVARINWRGHLKSKTHMKNDPDQTAKPIEYTKLCENVMYKLDLPVGMRI